MNRKKSNRGGAREGSGRKPGDFPVKLGIKVANDVREYLKHVKQLHDAAKEIDQNTTVATISSQIDADIRASKGFKTWQKQQSEK